jgi:ubiquinone biosynthesis protein Coq4
MFQSLRDYLTALRGVIRIVRDPNQTDAVFEIGTGIKRAGILGKVARRVRASSPEVDRLIAERYSPPLAKLDELLALPAGSLGRVFAENMTRMGYKVDFFPMDRVTDDGMYLLMRLRSTHDIWHTVTGLGTDVPGELGLQAFALAQLRSPLSMVLLTVGLLGSLLRPWLLARTVAEIRRGYRMGKVSRPFLPVRFEEGWARPLAEWRTTLGVPA